jgi:hypothetical protein
MTSSICENLVEKCEAAIIRICVQSGDFGKGPPPFKSDVASTNYLIRWTITRETVYGVFGAMATRRSTLSTDNSTQMAMLCTCEVACWLPYYGAG